MTARRCTTYPAALAAAGLTLGLAVPVAAAQEDGVGWTAPPVQFSAVGNDNCEVEFTMTNSTNATYAIDYIVDGEDPTTLAGLPGISGNTGVVTRTLIGLPPNRVEYVRTIGRLGVQAVPEVPLWTPGTPHTGGFDPVTATNTIDLRDLAALPNPESDTHTVTYQVVQGPHWGFKGWDPETRTFAVYTTEVSGCAEDDGGDGTGSLGIGSVGSLGSVDAVGHSTAEGSLGGGGSEAVITGSLATLDTWSTEAE